MHQQLLKAALGLALSSALLVACGSPEPLAQRSLGVIGGAETGSDRASVVYVTAEIATVGGNPISKVGSGSLLSPTLITTALHVVSRNPSNVPFTCDATGNDVSGSQGSQLGATVAPEKIAIYAGPLPDGEPLAHGVRLVTSGSTTICENDIAFVVLDRALDLPALAIHRGAPARVGDVLTAVGFGGEDTSQLNPRTERQVDVTAVGQWIRTFTVSQGPCEGDSGGPALSPAGELVGVFSSVSLDCKNANASAKYTDVSFFTPLVEQAFEAAGAGSPWSTGDGGAAGAANPVSTSGAAGAGAPSSADSDAAPTGNDSGCSTRPGSPSHAPGTLLLAWALLSTAGRARSRASRSCTTRATKTARLAQ